MFILDSTQNICFRQAHPRQSTQTWGRSCAEMHVCAGSEHARKALRQAEHVAASKDSGTGSELSGS